MRVLAIETASEACSVALFEVLGDGSAGDASIGRGSDSALIAHEHSVLGRGHAEHLIPMISALPDKGRADRLLVSVGPGSFTGVRVGVAAARALGVAWGAEVNGYRTLQLVAAMAQSQRKERVTVCVNGGHGEWFVQNFGESGEPENSAQSLKPEQAAREETYAYLAGNRARALHDIREPRGSVYETLPDARFALAVPGVMYEAGSLPSIPLYGRAPDATPQKQRVQA